MINVKIGMNIIHWYLTQFLFATYYLELQQKKIKHYQVKDHQLQILTHNYIFDFKVYVNAINITICVVYILNHDCNNIDNCYILIIASCTIKRNAPVSSAIRNGFVETGMVAQSPCQTCVRMIMSVNNHNWNCCIC